MIPVDSSYSPLICERCEQMSRGDAKQRSRECPVGVSAKHSPFTMRPPDLLQEQEQQEVLGGAGIDQFTHSVMESFRRLTKTMGQVLNILQLLLSFTFVTIFTQ